VRSPILSLVRLLSRFAMLAVAALAGACSEGRVATELPTAASGGAVLLGTVLNAGPAAGAPAAAGAGITVRVEGTASVTATDAAGQFVLSGLPEGAVTLRLKGTDCDAAVEVRGLANGRATTIRVRVAGSQATLQG
jgi:hypothetical protein